MNRDVFRKRCFLNISSQPAPPFPLVIRTARLPARLRHGPTASVPCRPAHTSPRRARRDDHKTPVRRYASTHESTNYTKLPQAATSTRRRRFHMATFSFERRPRSAHLRTCRFGNQSQSRQNRTCRLLSYPESTSHTAFPTCCSCTHTLPLLTVTPPPPTLVAGLYRIFFLVPDFELWRYRVVLYEMRMAISGVFGSRDR